MNKVLLLILSIAFGFALGTVAEAQVSLGGPLRVWEGPGSGKTIDVSPKQAVQVQKFKYDTRNSPSGNVHFNDSALGNATNGYFEGDLNGKKVYIPKQTMMEVLTRQNGPTVPAANPSAAVERLAETNKAQGKGPNGKPPCQNCTHSAGDDNGPYKGEAEIRKYACYFRVDKERDFNASNFETVMPILKEVAKTSRLPLSFLACTIQGESSFGVLTNGRCHRSGPYNTGACHGLGHFEVATAQAQMPAAIEIIRPLLQRRALPEKSGDAAVRLGLICNKNDFTEEAAIYQVGLIAAYAHQNVGDKINGENTNINALLMSTAIYRIGAKPLWGAPYSIFQSNDTSWIKTATFTKKSEKLNEEIRTYVDNLRVCMESGNFTRNWKKMPAKKDQCGG